MITTSRTVTVGNKESIIDTPIILYRGDRDVDVEFTINGNKYMFSHGGNVIYSTKASYGQLVINTPTGENMFSKIKECEDGKVIFTITKEMIDELVEVGFYSFQIRLFDSTQIARVTLPPVYQGIDIRNPIAAEDETNVVDISLVDYAIVQKDEYENLATFLPDGSYNKTDWESRGLITEAKLDKIEDALYTINENMGASDLSIFNRIESINQNVNRQITEFTNEADAEIEAFERSVNTNVEQFKIDTNAAMTAHKNEVSEELENVNTQLVDIENELYTTIDVKNFGARGDGITDDTVAIKLAISECANYTKSTLQFKGEVAFLVSETIEIPSNVNLDMQTPLNPTHNGVGMIVVGDNKNHIINIQKNTLSDWSDMSNVGVVFKNNTGCFIKILMIKGFTVGVKCIGDSKGFAYNTLEVGEIRDNHIGMLLTNANNGWCNENLYLGGRFCCYSSTHKGLDRYGVIIDSEKNYYNNNNVFIKPSFELHGSAVATPIIINYGRLNHFHYIRNESNSDITVVCNNASTENYVGTGYDDGYSNLEDNSSHPTNIITSGRRMYLEKFSNKIFDTGRLIDKICLYDGAKMYNISNCHIASSSDSYARVFNDRFTLAEDHIIVPSARGLGIFVDTTNIKRFVVRTDTISGFSGRVNIRCYDSEGSILDGDGAYVKGSSNRPFSYTNTFGGVWRNGSDGTNSTFFEVSDEVKKIAIILSGGTNNLYVKRFAIYTNSTGITNTYTGYKPENVNLGITYPTTGTWATGTRIVNANPSVGSAIAWVCVNGGAPGTWASEGTLESL